MRRAHRQKRSEASTALALVATTCTGFLLLYILFMTVHQTEVENGGGSTRTVRLSGGGGGGGGGGATSNDGCWLRVVKPRARSGHVAVCVPAKVSSTSFWSSVYWAYSNRTEYFQPCKKNKFVQDIEGCGWEKFLEMPAAAVSHVAQLAVFEKEEGGLYSFAIARDPIKRIISAYKSKVACDAQGFGTDRAGRRKIVKQLLRQAGRQGDYRECIGSFVEFVFLVHTVSSTPGEWLNPHFGPQNAKCRYDLIKYSAVVPLEELDEDKMAGLSRALGTPAAVRPFHSHGSSDGKTAAVPPDDLESLAAGALRLLYEVYAEDTRQDTLGWLYARDWGVDVGLVSDIIRMAPPAPHSS